MRWHHFTENLKVLSMTRGCESTCGYVSIYAIDSGWDDKHIQDKPENDMEVNRNIII